MAKVVPIRPQKARYRVAAGSSRAHAYEGVAPVAGKTTIGYPIGMGSTAASVLRSALPRLVAVSRHMARNSDAVSALEALVRRHVVGPRGMRLVSTAKMASGKEDKKTRQAVENVWRDFGTLGNPTICGELSWLDLENMVATALEREGNFFAIEHFGKNRGEFGYQIEPIPFDYLMIEKVARTSGGGSIDGGIEFNAEGRRVAYYFRTGSGQERRVAADRVIHVYRPVGVGVHFGEPSFATGIKRLMRLDRFETAAVENAEWSAKKMAFFETEITDEGISADGGEADEMPESFEGGEIYDLPTGKKLASFDPQFPTADMQAFGAHYLRSFAAGCGVSYAGISGDLKGANYSSLRDSRSEERAEWQARQNLLAMRFHDRVFAKLVEAATLSGALMERPAAPRELRSHMWRARGWQPVSEKDAATGNASDLSNGLRAPSAIVADRGDDYDETLDQIAADIAKAKAKGVPLAFLTGAMPVEDEEPPREGAEE